MQLPGKIKIPAPVQIRTGIILITLLFNINAHLKMDEAFYFGTGKNISMTYCTRAGCTSIWFSPGEILCFSCDNILNSQLTTKAILLYLVDINCWCIFIGQKMNSILYFLNCACTRCAGKSLLVKYGLFPDKSETGFSIAGRKMAE